MGAAEETARLTIELSVTGSEQQRSSSSPDFADGRFDEHYRISLTTFSDGELGNVNTFDPQFAERMIAMAAAVQQQLANAAAGIAVEELAEDDDYRYLSYFGQGECDSDVRVRIEREIDGAYSDVQGMVPYSVTQRADYRGDATTRMMLCLSGSLVVDVKGGEFFAQGIGIPAASGSVRRSVEGRPEERSEASLTPHAEVAEWLQAQLRRAPLEGRREATLPLTRNLSGDQPATGFSGSANVMLSWRLER